MIESTMERFELTSIQSEGFTCFPTLPRPWPSSDNCGQESSTTYVFRRVSRCPIQAGFDIAFENPFGIVPMTQQVMGLSHRIGTAALTPKAIGVAVGLRFRDGIEAEQVQGLHGSIGHGGNPEASPLIVALGDVHPAERLRSITVPAQGAESGRLGLRGVPEDSVHTGGLRTRIT